jgi:hypothetical protein
MGILPDIYRVDQYAAPAFGSECDGLTASANVEDRRRTSCSIWLEGNRAFLLHKCEDQAFDADLHARM